MRFHTEDDDIEDVNDKYPEKEIIYVTKYVSRPNKKKLDTLVNEIQEMYVQAKEED